MKKIGLTIVFILLTPFAMGLCFVDWVSPGEHDLTVKGWFQMWKEVVE